MVPVMKSYSIEPGDLRQSHIRTSVQFLVFNLSLWEWAEDGGEILRELSSIVNRSFLWLSYSFLSTLLLGIFQ